MLVIHAGYNSPEFDGSGAASDEEFETEPNFPESEPEQDTDGPCPEVKVHAPSMHGPVVAADVDKKEPPVSSRYYWVQPILDATSKVRSHFIGEPRALRLASGCTGLWSEGAALQALGVPLEPNFCCMADGKPDAQKFVRANFGRYAKCFWNSLDEAERGVKCVMHQKNKDSSESCALPPPGHTDIAVVCTPCQPFSVLRDARSLPASQHKLFATTFGETGSLVSYAAALKPKCLIVEQVLGFEKAAGPGKASFKEQLHDRILGIPHQSGEGSHFAAATTLTVNSKTFLQSSRPRLYNIYFTSELGGAGGLALLRSRYEDFEKYMLGKAVDPCSLLQIRGDDFKVIDSDGEASHDDAGEDREEAWMLHTKKKRAQMGMTLDSTPWSGNHGLAGFGKKPRCIDVIDVAYWAYLVAHPQKCDRSPTPSWWVDASQGVQRAPWGEHLPCINQDSLPFSFKLDRLLSSEDRFKVMGWDTEAVRMTDLEEKKLCGLIGESLHLGCIGVICYLVFLTDGPWWPAPARPASSASVQAVASSGSGEGDSQPVAKRQRRVGCLSVPHGS